MENYGYRAGEIVCAVAVAKGGRSILHENVGMRDVLERIARWEFPETGLYWDDEKTEPMSYGAAYGTAGERAYLQALAVQALGYK